MQRRRRTHRHLTRTGAATLLALAAVSGSTGASVAQTGAQTAPAPGADATCAQPYRTAYAAITYPAPPTPPPWEGGRVLEHVPGILDTDGDGTADTITDLPGNAIRITRSSGSISFPANTYLANRFDPADLDGDGRTELVVSVPLGGGTGGVFVVPGTVANGPVDVTKEAVRVPDLLAGSRPVGDQDGDGRTDLASSSEVDGSGDTLVYSGAALIAPGPGGTAADDPIRRLDGMLVGRIPFEADVTTLVTIQGDEVVVHLDPAVRLTVAGSGVSLRNVTPTTTGATAVVDGADTWLVLGHGDRSGNQVWGWKLTDPCNTDPSPTTPTTTTPADVGGRPADPATPVSGAPSYTG